MLGAIQKHLPERAKRRRHTLCSRTRTHTLNFKVALILDAVKGGHADTVDHLLQQGFEISGFQVHPIQEGEFVTEDSKNPFSVAWYQQRYDIFLLLLDATLTQKCRKRRWECSELLPQLDAIDPRERLAERLAIWLKSRYWVPVDPDSSYAGPNMVIWRTLELVFGMGMFLRGDGIIVSHLIEKKAPIPEKVLVFLRRHWNGMRAGSSNILTSLRLRPAMLDIILTAWPLMWRKDELDGWDEDLNCRIVFWLYRVAHIQVLGSSRNELPDSL
ncbi:hypothetical protein FOFC_13709 [Fusarium oxysporum]|nr:hypothetical protein FOFC_13709 [Fusarium oxysporum]